LRGATDDFLRFADRARCRPGQAGTHQDGAGLVGRNSAYEDGEYGSSAGLLQNALSAGLFLYSDKVAAHKYLARDPDLELTLAESGHPLWAPVFKSLKHSVTKS
jgi:hypothetical protein